MEFSAVEEEGDYMGEKLLVSTRRCDKLVARLGLWGRVLLLSLLRVMDKKKEKGKTRQRASSIARVDWLPGFILFFPHPHSSFSLKFKAPEHDISGLQVQRLGT
ncbi:uncharacterized protein TM35_000301780 [Trypanosoma theileri]|uniref:Uncharacterized protein n=1 Tax=Trypanosoma theileri TaxID=67003 RepID=A0A1X0NNR6_9TRYP|nr:uncharacterized protein TM35_000301780 [Trypanosoma theileri]ORC86138.1 hypothetical protein TM35_000301780 [Trypanosoma theileri]